MFMPKGISKILHSCFPVAYTFLKLCYPKGAIIFYREGGPSVCDRGSPILSGPPWACAKKFWSPLGMSKKIRNCAEGARIEGPHLVKKFWSPLCDPQKILVPPVDPLKKTVKNR